MEALLRLYKKQSGRLPDRIKEIPGSVSTRRYFRIEDGSETFVGTYSPDKKETRAFITFAKHFYAKNIPVPQILSESKDEEYYIQSDLGEQRLHELVISRKGVNLDEDLLNLYKHSLDDLARMQVQGHEGLDYSVAVPRSAFDYQSIYWDLNHFKYYFLKPSGIPFDEEKLENDFHKLAELASGFPNKFFMFRDFQTRNIMIRNGKPYFIDFQGGRKGPLQYDLASLLLESRTALSQEDQDKLFDYYQEALRSYIEIDKEVFRKQYFTLALIRILQVLGTYGLRGNLEKKAVFIQSIPHGLQNLENLLSNIDKTHISEDLYRLLKRLAEMRANYATLPEHFDGLTITICSFSYRKPLPDDISGNGGGFVFDCRYLNNPGRHEKYRSLNGFDNEVRDFLGTDLEVDSFITSIQAQIEKVVHAYKDRNFSNLMLSFGCTGGQHRSVYVASQIADWCRQLPDLRVIEKHREIGISR